MLAEKEGAWYMLFAYAQLYDFLESVKSTIELCESLHTAK